MRATCLNAIYELAKKDPRIVFVGSDLGAGVLAEMRRELPKQFLMEGISEQHLIGLVAGLALEGKIPYVNTIATFLTRRCYEQILLDVVLPNLPVRLIGNGGGAVYAPLGPTHVATDDMSLMLGLGLTIVAPVDRVEMARLMPLTVDCLGPLYIRLGWGEPLVEANNPTLQFDCDVTIISTGNITATCIQAMQLLKENGISTQVWHHGAFSIHTDFSTANVSKLVVSVEEGIFHGGLGSIVARYAPVLSFGMPLFPEGYGTRLEMLARYGLTAESIAQKVKELYERL